MSKKIAIAAIGAVLAISLNSGAFAKKDETMAPPKGMEKCFGIAKAGMNDCGGNKYSCAGNAKVDSDKHGWLSVPKGTCNKIVGGSTTEG